jgi:WD40 repeat protein
MAQAPNFEKAVLAWNLPWDADWITAVAFCGNRRLAAGNNLGQILLWDLAEKAGGTAPPPVRRLDGHTNVISRLLPTPDGKTLLSSSYDHTIRTWDAQAMGEKSEPIVLNARLRDEISKRRYASKMPDPITATVKVQQPASALTAHHEWVSGMSLSRDGKLLLSGDDAGQVILWDREAGKELRRWTLKSWAYAVALSPDGKQALLSERKPLVFDSGQQAGIALYDAATGQVQHDMSAAFKGLYISAAAFSPDGKVLAIGRGGEADGLNGKVFLIDPATGKKQREFSPGHEHGITDIAFHPSGKHLASSGRDTLVRIWDVASGKLVKELGKSRGGQFKDWIHAVSFSPDGLRLAGSDMAGSVQVWSLG